MSLPDKHFQKYQAIELNLETKSLTIIASFRKKL